VTRHNSEETRDFAGIGSLQKGVTAFAVFFAISVIIIAELTRRGNPDVFDKG